MINKEQEPQSGHFLNSEQKRVKGFIMHELMSAFFDNLKANETIFQDPQLISDLFFSILVMFNREMLCHYFGCYGINPKIRNKAMKELFNTITKQVTSQLVKGMH